MQAFSRPCAKMERRTIEEYGQASRTISTASLNVLRHLHSRPIKPVVFWCPLGPLRGGKPYLRAGFTLRCFQRLSLPNSATQRCPWRDNWHTGGSSIQVLSYYGRLPSSFLTRMVDRDRQSVTTPIKSGPDVSAGLCMLPCSSDYIFT